MEAIQYQMPFTVLTMSEKTIEELRMVNEWTSISDWAIKCCEAFPELFENAIQEVRETKSKKNARKLSKKK